MTQTALTLKTKELRVYIDGISQLVKYLHTTTDVNNWRPFNSHEVNQCYDALMFGKAWLGKCLEELDVPTPYSNDGNRKTVQDIEPVADTIDNQRETKLLFLWESYENFKQLNEIEKIDCLREEIKNLTVSVKFLDHESFGEKITREFAIARTNSYSYLCEARMWLGFELGNIKERSK